MQKSRTAGRQALDVKQQFVPQKGVALLSAHLKWVWE